MRGCSAFLDVEQRGFGAPGFVSNALSLREVLKRATSIADFLIEAGPNKLVAEQDKSKAITQALKRRFAEQYYCFGSPSNGHSSPSDNQVTKAGLRECILQPGTWQSTSETNFSGDLGVGRGQNGGGAPFWGLVRSGSRSDPVRGPGRAGCTEMYYSPRHLARRGLGCPSFSSSLLSPPVPILVSPGPGLSVR